MRIATTLCARIFSRVSARPDTDWQLPDPGFNFSIERIESAYGETKKQRPCITQQPPTRSRGISRSSVPCLRKTFPALWDGEIPWPSAVSAAACCASVSCVACSGGGGDQGESGAPLVMMALVSALTLNWAAQRATHTAGQEPRAQREREARVQSPEARAERKTERDSETARQNGRQIYLIGDVFDHCGERCGLRHVDPASTASTTQQLSGTHERHAAWLARRAVQAPVPAGPHGEGTHTRNGSLGSDARIILNLTFSPPAAFGGIARGRSRALPPARLAC